MSGPIRSVALSLALLGATSCARDEQPGTDCSPLARAYDDRLAALQGPLGCDATQTLAPDPPDGCDGAMALVADARVRLDANLELGECSAEPPSLADHVAEVESAFAEAHAFDEHVVERGGFEIAVREFGAEFAGAAPTVVLMHGFPDDQQLYDLVAPLVAQTHHTLTFDFVGWGRSSSIPAGAAVTMDGLRQDLEAVLATFSVVRAVVVVHDASAWPGIDWALDNPDAVAALVLLNSTYHPVAGVAPPYVIRALMADDLRPRFLELLDADPLLTRSLFEAQVGRFFSQPDARDTYLRVFAHYDGTVSSSSRETLAAGLLQEVVARAARVPAMRAFDRPVAIAFGADDPYLNTNAAEAYDSLFPDSTLELIPAAGHYVPLDAPERVAAVIRAAATR